MKMFRDAEVRQPKTLKWRTFTVVICVIGSAFLFFAWLNQWPSFSIGNDKISDELTYKIQSGDSHPHYLRLKVTGQINGSARVKTPVGDIELKPGVASHEIANEFYDREFKITYKPKNVTQGHLTIVYDPSVFGASAHLEKRVSSTDFKD